MGNFKKNHYQSVGFGIDLQVVMPDHIVSICLEQKCKDIWSEQAMQKNVCHGKLLNIILVCQNFYPHMEASLFKDNRGT